MNSNKWSNLQRDPASVPHRKGNGSNYRTVTTGPLHIGLTVIVLVFVAVVSFGIAYLTRENERRSAALLSLTFAAPVAALMLAVLLVEKNTSAMTPSASRKAQAIFAGCSILLAAAVGLGCQFANKEASTPVEITETVWNDTIILLDKSGSMEQNNEDANGAVRNLIDRMPDSTQVGLILYTDVIKDSVPIGVLTDEQKDKINVALKTNTSGTTDFSRAVSECLKLIGNMPDQNTGLNVVMISDGYDRKFKDNSDSYIAEFKNYPNTKFNYITIGGYSSELDRLAKSTGGQTITVDQLDQLQNEITRIVTQENSTMQEQDALRNIHLSLRAKIVVGIMLVLLGLLVGISLTVMLSVQGQRRFQAVLSPLMAIAAFLLLAFGKDWITVAWIREGCAFTLIGIVVMRRNRSGSQNYTVGENDSRLNTNW